MSVVNEEKFMEILQELSTIKAIAETTNREIRDIKESMSKFDTKQQEHNTKIVLLEKKVEDLEEDLENAKKDIQKVVEENDKEIKQIIKEKEQEIKEIKENMNVNIMSGAKGWIIKAIPFGLLILALISLATLISSFYVFKNLIEKSNTIEKETTAYVRLID